jgi:CHAD domain-containing protein
LTRRCGKEGGIDGHDIEQLEADAVRLRAFELSHEPDADSPEENWLRAEREFTVQHDYDTVDRDLERIGITLSRLPAEAGVVWRLSLPRGERVEEWEPGNRGLAPPAAIARLIEQVAAGKPLVPAPPLSTDPGAIRLREMIEAQRRELLAHDPGTRLGEDPENLHLHRVAARRTRAFLRATRNSLDPVWRRSLLGPLRELGGATGPVRDLDVLLEHVRGALRVIDEPDRSAGDLLLAVLEREHEVARRTLLAALDGIGYRLLHARLRLPPRLASGVESIPLERIARKEFRRLVDVVDRLGKHPGESEIHALRMMLKRVRYAAELAAPDRKERRRFLAEAKILQDLLGEHQDALVVERYLRASTVSDAASAAAFVAGRIAERQHTRRALVRERLPTAWRRLRKSGARLD